MAFETPRQPATLDLEDVCVSYNGQLVLEHLTFCVPHGARLAVVGPNGAGKTTLFKALVGLLPLQSGQIFIHGQPLGHHQDCVAYIPQREEVDWRFPVTVHDVVMMGRFGRRGWLRRPTPEDREVVAHSLERLGITRLANRPIGELSGGQQQRAFLARALAQDLNLASERFEQVLLLNRRVIAFGSPGQVFTPAHLSQAFGSHVLFLEGTILVDQCCPPKEEGGRR